MDVCVVIKPMRMYGSQLGLIDIHISLRRTQEQPIKILSSGLPILRFHFHFRPIFRYNACITPEPAQFPSSDATRLFFSQPFSPRDDGLNEVNEPSVATREFTSATNGNHR
jgi:hypothetical protein